MNDKINQEIVRSEVLPAPAQLASEVLLAPAQLAIVDGVVQNLPEIIGAVKEIYSLHQRGQMLDKVLQLKFAELNVNKDNFKVLVEGMSELLKLETVDPETKAVCRQTIKDLTQVFLLNMRSSQDISNYLKGF